ncbi:MAG: hypothetical protein FJX71_03730 [Alphaproteobacteria bacterium]|nr:hypothetical protein [Alphaproteobacteria bacterium]
MLIKNLLATAILILTTSQTLAAEDNENRNRCSLSAASALLKDTHSTNEQLLQPNSDQKLVRGAIKNVGAMVHSFISKPDGALPWEMRELYADHLLGLVSLYLDMNERNIGNITSRLKELEKSREENILQVLMQKPSYSFAPQVAKSDAQQEEATLETAKPPSPILGRVSAAAEIAVY